MENTEALSILQRRYDDLRQQTDHLAYAIAIYVEMGATFDDSTTVEQFRTADAARKQAFEDLNAAHAAERQAQESEQ